jgi:hypothetical protein
MNAWEDEGGLMDVDADADDWRASCFLSCSAISRDSIV